MNGELLDTLLQGASSDDEDIALRSLEAGYRAAAQRKTFAVGFDEQLERILQSTSPFAIRMKTGYGSVQMRMWPS